MKYLIIGAGPAGLTAGLLLSKKNEDVTILEAGKQVGGISKTVVYKKYRFDIGGHRFFTKVSEVMDLWKEILPKDFMTVGRMSHIFYQGKFYNYPLEPFNALTNLGIIKAAEAFMSHLKIKHKPIDPEETLEDVYINSFGHFLYEKFFETYSKRLWGIPPGQMAPDWGKARVGRLSLLSAVKDAFFPKSGEVKSLIKEFNYPKLGPGQMWEAFAREVKKKKGKIILNSKVEKIHHKNWKITGVETENGRVFKADHLISSMPLKELILGFFPRPPERVINAAQQLKYRDYVLVALIVNKKNVFTDQWIYLQDPGFSSVRMQNVNNWSISMVGDKNKTVLGMEYVVSQSDSFWQLRDKQLIELAKDEVEKLGFARKEEVIDAKVVRELKVYPVYDLGYQKYLNTVREYLSSFDNLSLVGRNGMHKYNNMDHSMLTAMLAVENIYGAKHDLWQVNADQEYHESKK